MEGQELTRETVHNMADVGEVFFSSWGPTAAAIGRESEYIFLIDQDVHTDKFVCSTRSMPDHLPDFHYG